MRTSYQEKMTLYSIRNVTSLCLYQELNQSFYVEIIRVRQRMQASGRLLLLLLQLMTLNYDDDGEGSATIQTGCRHEKLTYYLTG